MNAPSSGRLYKQQGKDIAVEKGLEFVGPKMAEFVRQAKQLFEEQPTQNPLVVHCWRGGMRSGAVAWLLETSAGARCQVNWRIQGLPCVGQEDFKQLTNLARVGWDDRCGEDPNSSCDARPRSSGGGLGGHCGPPGLSLWQPWNAFHNRALSSLAMPATVQFKNATGTVQFGWKMKAASLEKYTCPKIYSIRCGWLRSGLLSAPEEERLDELCLVYGDAKLEALKDAFGRIREKLGGALCRDAIQALDQGDLRAAAAIGLVYYDKLYTHTQQRYARATLTPVDGRGSVRMISLNG